MKRLDVTQHRTVRGLTRLALVGLICCGMLSSRGAFASPAELVPILVTNVADFNRVVSTDSNRVVSVRLEAAVWWANAKSGRLVLAGDSGAEQLEVDLPCQIPEAGDRLGREGGCLAGRTKDG